MCRVDLLILIFILVATVSCKENATYDSHEIVIPLIVPARGTGVPDGPLQIKIIEKMFNEANEMALFPGYRLKLEIYDDNCNGYNTSEIGWNLSKRRPYHPLILGPTCSTSCEHIASWVHNWQSHVLARCALLKLANRKYYPGYINVEQMITAYQFALLRMSKEVGWRHITLAVESRDIWLGSITVMLEEAAKIGIAIKEIEVFSDGAVLAKRLQEDDHRIVLILAYTENLAKFACGAKKYGYYGSNRIFLTILAVLPMQTTASCDYDTVSEVFESGLLSQVHGEGMLDASHRSEMGHNYTEVESFLAEYNAGPLRHSRFSIYSYGTSILAILKRLLGELAQRSLRYEDLVAQPSELLYNLVEKIRLDLEVKRATSVLREFVNPIVRLVASDVIQMRNGNLDLVRVQIATGKGDMETRRISSILWKTRNGKAPREEELIIVQFVDVPLPLYIITCIAALCSIMLSVGIGYIQVRYWDKRAIRLSSPKLNILILIGCCFCVTVVVMHRIPESLRSFFCMFRVITFVYRVHQLFVKVIKTSKTVKDRRLFGFVAGWLTVNYVYLALWFSLDAFVDHYEQIDYEYDEEDDDVYYRSMAHRCRSNNEFYFIGGLLLLQGLMLTFGGFLAFLTRNVQLKEVVDAQQVTKCIYAVVFYTILAASGLFFLQKEVAISYGIANGLCVAGIITMQLLLFAGRLPFFTNKADIVRVDFKTGGSTLVGTSAQVGASVHIDESK